MKLDLNDLQPTNATLKLSEGGVFTLGKITLRTHMWLRNRFGKENIKTIFENQNVPEIAEIAFFLLKEKDKVKTLDEFLELIVNQQDRVNLVKALLETLGISQPVLDKLTKEAATEGETQALPTGADSTT